MASPPTSTSRYGCLECSGEGLILLECKEHSVCHRCLQTRTGYLGASQMFRCDEKLHSTSPPNSPSEQDGDKIPTDQPPVWIYVDDSNMWIAAKRLTSVVRRFKTSEDHRVRIDIGKLTDVVAAGRPVGQGFLYGSEPPPVDTVWEKIRKRGWKVTSKKRHQITKKEKQVDTQLAVDITKRACTTPMQLRSTIIIISGDADMIPAFESVLEGEGWKIEVYMWKHALSAHIKKLSRDNVNFKVCPLDDHLGKVTFTSMRFDIRILHERVAEVKASAIVLAMERNAFPRRVLTPQWCKQLESLVQWPFQYYWLRDHHGLEMDDLLLVFKKDATAGLFDVAQCLETMQQYPLPHVKQDKDGVQTFLQYSQKKAGLLEKYTIENVGTYSVTDCCDGIESDTLSVSSDDSEPWELVRHDLQRKRHSSGQLYTEECPYGLNCIYGTRCYYKHTDEHKKFFHQNMGRGNPLRKVKPCEFYQQGRCKKNENCHFAHGEEDAWCLRCRTQGHYTQNCPDGHSSN